MCVGLDPFLTYSIDDLWLHRFCAAQLAEGGFAPIGKIADAMNLSVSTLRRDRIRLVEEGLLGFVVRTGPQRASKATPAVADAISRMFELGNSKTSIASTLGLSEGTVRKVLKQQLDDSQPTNETLELPGFEDLQPPSNSETTASDHGDDSILDTSPTEERSNDASLPEPLGSIGAEGLPEGHRDDTRQPETKTLTDPTAETNPVNDESETLDPAADNPPLLDRDVDATEGSVIPFQASVIHSEECVGLSEECVVPPEVSVVPIGDTSTQPETSHSPSIDFRPVPELIRGEIGTNREVVPFLPLDEVEATSIPYASPLEKVFTTLGRIEEAPIDFQNTKDVAHAGGLLGLALLSETGLMEHARTVYGRLKNCWYGLRPVFWTLTLIALLRIKRPENMKEHDPAALGTVLGLPRGPEVKTIRRKLAELAKRGKAAELHRELAKRRAEQREEVLGTLYIDGHIRDYYGKHKIGRRFLTRKNGTEHGVMDGWVHLEDGQPLFVLHAPCDESLTQLFPELLEEIREVIGDDRRVCLVFDRECWSHKLFWKILHAGFDFMTYRKGTCKVISDEEFEEVTVTIDGHEVKYNLAEETFKEDGWPELRLITVARSDGGQTQIVASGQQTWVAMGKAAGEPDAPAGKKCFRMFGRWCQENWLKYAKEQFALDVLVDYQTELDDGDRLVPNSVWSRRDREVRSTREQLKRAQEKFGKEVLKPRDKQETETRTTLRQAVKNCEEILSRAIARRSEVPATIRLGDCEGRDSVKMSYERKLLTDTVKLCAYDIETMLVKLLPDWVRRSDQESRTLIRNFLQTPGDLRIEPGCLKISLAQQSAPRYTEALIRLCNQLNQLEPMLPESGLRLEFFVSSRPVG